MKLKVVIKVQLNCAKCHTNALKVAAKTEGVNFVAIEGEDKVVVIGDGVDPVELTINLRKKLRQANIISVTAG